MNPITHSLNEIRHSIPASVLQYAFIGNRVRAPRVPVSLDTVIREKVIEDRVLPDCDIVGGIRITLDITGLPFTMYEDRFRVYKLTLGDTGGRHITSAISVGNYNYMSTIVSDTAESSVMGDMKTLQRAAAGASPMYTPEVRLIGDNIIIIEDDVRAYSNSLFLYCTVSNDAEMNTLPVRSYGSFAEAVVLATKAYIYNHCRLTIGSGVLSGGVELGVMREIVDEYSDANELYREYIKTVWARKSLLADKTAKRRHLRTIVPRP